MLSTDRGWHLAFSFSHVVPPECYLQGETKIEPDLRLSSGCQFYRLATSYNAPINVMPAGVGEAGHRVGI